MRLVKVKYVGGGDGWLNPMNVAEILPTYDGDTAKVFFIGRSERFEEAVVDEPVEKLAERVENALQEWPEEVEALPPPRAKEATWSVPVPMCTITSKEYRGLLDDAHAKFRMIEGYIAEVRELKDKLAKTEHELVRVINEKNLLCRKIEEMGGE